MSSKGYNGWSNYETWNVALWIGNEQGSYSYWQEKTKEAYRDAEAERSLTRLEVATRNLAEVLEEEIKEAAPDLGASMFADLLGAALCEVNWREIAGNWLEEVADDIDREEADALDDEGDEEDAPE